MFVYIFRREQKDKTFIASISQLCLDSTLTKWYIFGSFVYVVNVFYA